jgi:hypothetical protein
MKLSAAQEAILLSMAKGDTLKSHRHLDGVKAYQLHRLDGSIAAVHRSTIEALSKHENSLAAITSSRSPLIG